MKPKMVTIIVPAYNKAPFIAQTLQSIRNQTYKDWELIVVDDLSTDDTVNVVKKNLDPKKMKIIQRKKNEGICHVLNDALKHINSKYFIQVDGDDWISPETLEVLVKRMEAEPPTTALAYANCVHWYYKNKKDHFHKIVKPKDFKNRYEFVTTPGMVFPRFYRTECVKKVGGWEMDDLTNGKLLEDRRMLLRLLDEHTFTHVDSNLYNFRYHGKNLSHSKNAGLYNELVKHFTDQALKRWGNSYRADYSVPSHWLRINLVPVKKGGKS
ncbi:glycosyltransferase involved in cell wall biosynthesis [Paenibacillus anaericanus]|uniref:glycosyltransferase family 2 protein n=1 Tax=Paenibacillus anaericanus TaxID=170367 RepID=UPI00278B3E28|nr:glycosyltransferase family A protein [Paenibacillus anaericanus]MDQ0090655.1 glycosyltransferase involved in cell wall biosynthesis [Paenibacillus anaericanus]